MPCLPLCPVGRKFHDGIEAFHRNPEGVHAFRVLLIREISALRRLKRVCRRTEIELIIALSVQADDRGHLAVLNLQLAGIVILLRDVKHSARAGSVGRRADGVTAIRKRRSILRVLRIRERAYTACRDHGGTQKRADPFLKCLFHFVSPYKQRGRHRPPLCMIS